MHPLRGEDIVSRSGWLDRSIDSVRTRNRSLSRGCRVGDLSIHLHQFRLWWSFLGDENKSKTILISKYGNTLVFHRARPNLWQCVFFCRGRVGDHIKIANLSHTNWWSERC